MNAWLGVHAYGYTAAWMLLIMVSHFIIIDIALKNSTHGKYSAQK